MANSNFSKFLQSTIITLLLNSILLVSSITLQSEIEVLRSLKTYIDPTSINPSSFLSTWDFSLDPCESSGGQFLGVLCTIPSDNTSSRVTEIDLDASGYDGFLTSIIGNLTELSVLNLAKNKFRGPIPDSIADLRNLTRLVLSDNYFTGVIPVDMTNLRELKIVDMSRNRLSGAIPAKISGFRRLIHLSLSENGFSGHIPDLSPLWQLNSLDLSSNQLYGTLPRLPTSLRMLSLNRNILSGQITSIRTLQRLQSLDVSENRFTGGIRSELFELPELAFANVSVNRFRSLEVPRFFETQLHTLDAHLNNLGGHLPVSLVTLESLVTINLSHNQYSGAIPAEYGIKLEVLDSLFLDYNFLTGNIPPQFVGIGSRTKGSLANNCLQCPKNVLMCHGGQRPASQCAGAV